HLDAREHAPVRRRQPRDLGQLQVAVLAVGEPLARKLPGFPEIAASPDARTVPLARCGGIDRAGGLIENSVVDRPPLAEGAPHIPVPAVAVALQHEAALAGSDE